MLVLVRHAMPEFGPQTPPHEWRLSEAGRSAAILLAGVFPADSRLVASAEPKAWQTLEPAGHVERDPRFNEILRTEPWDGDYRQLRREYVEGINHSDWEPRTQVAERFNAAIAEHLDIAHDRPLVVATHGMAMTVWLTARIGLPDPGGFWTDLQFPDAHRVDLAARTITRVHSPARGRPANRRRNRHG